VQFCPNQAISFGGRHVAKEASMQRLKKHRLQLSRQKYKLRSALIVLRRAAGRAAAQTATSAVEICVIYAYQTTHRPRKVVVRRIYLHQVRVYGNYYFIYSAAARVRRAIIIGKSSRSASLWLIMLLECVFAAALTQLTGRPRYNCLTFHLETLLVSERVKTHNKKARTHSIFLALIQ
jgi:hypothetical protein